MQSNPVLQVIRENFLKKRYIFCITRGSITGPIAVHPDFTIINLDRDQLDNYIDFKIPNTELSTIIQRTKNSKFRGFIAVERATERPVGIAWAILSGSTECWHDKFCIPPGDALIINAYIDENHRNRGVYTFMRKYMTQYLLEVERCNRVYGIIEATNYPSIRVQEKIGFYTRSPNYLIKFFGYNIFSIFKSADSWQIHYVFRVERENEV